MGHYHPTLMVLQLITLVCISDKNVQVLSIRNKLVLGVGEKQKGRKVLTSRRLYNRTHQASMTAALQDGRV